MTADKTPNPIAKALEPFVCGGSAATFASVCIHPMDLAKVRFSLPSGSKFDVFLVVFSRGSLHG